MKKLLIAFAFLTGCVNEPTEYTNLSGQWKDVVLLNNTTLTIQQDGNRLFGRVNGTPEIDTIGFWVTMKGDSLFGYQKFGYQGKFYSFIDSVRGSYTDSTITLRAKRYDGGVYKSEGFHWSLKISP